MAKRKYPEQKLQIACADYLKALETLTGKFIFWHTPNGGLRSKAAGALFKAMGTKAGVPDIIVLLMDGTILFFELKAKGGYLTANQKEFHAKLKKLHFDVEVIVAETPAEAVAAIARTLREAGLKEAQ